MHTTFASNLEIVEDKIYVWSITLADVDMDGVHGILGNLQYHTEAVHTPTRATRAMR